MRIAALTYVYNESVNLPLWVKHYGRSFGASNLFVINHGSDDGSVNGLGEVNVINVAHTPFDDNKKSLALSSMHLALLQHFDCVIITDCDEFLAPDPQKYDSLRTYIEVKRPSAATCIGLAVHHILDREPPLDVSKPILSQRNIAYFCGPATKPLVSSLPTIWAAGGHICSVEPSFDPDLFVFHMKYMDYGFGVQRQLVNAENAWSEAQQSSGHGLHHRYGLERYVLEGFLGPMDAVRSGQLAPFDFTAEVAAMANGLTQRDGFFVPGRVEPKFVEIPARFRNCV